MSRKGPLVTKPIGIELILARSVIWFLMSHFGTLGTLGLREVLARSVILPQRCPKMWHQKSNYTTCENQLYTNRSAWPEGPSKTLYSIFFGQNFCIMWRLHLLPRDLQIRCSSRASKTGTQAALFIPRTVMEALWLHLINRHNWSITIFQSQSQSRQNDCDCLSFNFQSQD